MSLRISIDPAPLRRQVVERLRIAIMDGELPVGVRLVERELIVNLGVSRPSVREALRQLQSEGLVVQTPSRGVEIPRLSAKEVEELYQVRIELEGLAARLFTQRASDALLKEVRDALTEIESAREHPGDRRRFRESKSRFYDIIFKGAENETAARALRTYHQRLALVWVTISTQAEKAKRKAEMRAIVDAIERRDAAAAERRYQHHLACSLEEALRSLSSTHESLIAQPG